MGGVGKVLGSGALLPPVVGGSRPDLSAVPGHAGAMGGGWAGAAENSSTPCWAWIVARSRRCSSAWKSRAMWSAGATPMMGAAPSLPWLPMVPPSAPVPNASPKPWPRL